MFGLDWRKLVDEVVGLLLVGSITIGLVACGSGSSGAAQSHASDAASKPPTSVRRQAAEEQAAKKHRAWRKTIRHYRADARVQLAQVQACLESASGYGRAHKHTGLGVGDIGFTGLPYNYAGSTFLRTRFGVYFVGIAPTPRRAIYYLDQVQGEPGGSDRQGSYDGSVSLVGESFGRGGGVYRAERAEASSCAFSIPAASGQPKPEPKSYREYQIAERQACKHLRCFGRAFGEG